MKKSTSDKKYIDTQRNKEFLKEKTPSNGCNSSVPKRKKRRAEKKVPAVVVKLSSCDTPLIIASKQGNTTELETLLNNGADVNTQCVHGRTALWYAVSNGYLKCVEKLLEFKSDVSNQDEDGVTPLMEAAKFNHVKIVKALINSGADVDVQCKNKRNAIHYAAFQGNIKCVKKLVKANCELNNVNEEGRTVLIAALYRGHLDIVTYLVKLVNPNIQCNIGRSALHYAAAGGYSQCCKMLVKSGAIIDLKDIYGKTALIIAATRGYHAVVENLLEMGADINIQDNNGRNSLMCIANKSSSNNENEITKGPTPNFEKCLACLISSKINVNAKCNYGLSALHYASLHGFTDCIKHLLSTKIKINACDNRGETALHKAACEGQSQAIILLIKRGADENIESLEGKTPYDLAKEYNQAICTWLFKKARSEDAKFKKVLIYRKNQRLIGFSENERLEFIDALNNVLINSRSKNAQKGSSKIKSVAIIKNRLTVRVTDKAAQVWLINRLDHVNPWNDVELMGVPNPI